ncbi:UDP-2,3-diacylglucosamine diphosphatase LpxI [Myxococcota bacterium]|nr:UDP-2,3-diacylglucosamine diphosphatase LpxI [Myxococcota bacterium]MCZ7618594.1 UDP-2,3-diacylglucosamine diphosphatase LpxI [Myxococcota bacterium]
MAGTLGVVAGEGRLPFEVVRGARRAGRRVWVAALRGFADPRLEDEAERCAWLHVGEVGALLAGLRAEGVREIVLCGLVPKALLFADPSLVRLDAVALQWLAGLRDRRDDALLRRLADALEAEGFRVLSQSAYTHELLAPEGALGGLPPTPEQRAEVEFGWPIAKAIGRLDIGQTLIVRERTVLAVEAIEGTDAAIRRGAALGGGDVSVLKVSKPNQDARLDVPVIGPETIVTLAAAGARLLAVEAGRTLVLERAALVSAADAAGICVLGVPTGGLGAGAAKPAGAGAAEPARAGAVEPAGAGAPESARPGSGGSGTP